MKTKTLFSLFVFATLVVLSLSFASALTLAQWTLTSNADASSVNSDITANALVNGSGLTNFTIDSNGASASSWTTGSTDSNDYFEIVVSPKSGKDLTVTDINFGTFTDGVGNFEVRWSKSSTFSSSTSIASGSLTGSQTKDISGLNIKVNDGETLRVRFFGYNADSSDSIFRINDGTLNIEGSVSSSGSEDVEFCRNGESGGNLEITKIDLNAPGDDEEWSLLDEVEIEVDVDNDGSEDIEDVVVEMGLFKNGDNQVGELAFTNTDEEQEEVGDIDNGKDETATFSFKVPADFEDGIYTLVFKAYADGDEDTECTQRDHTASIDVQREDDEGKFIVVDEMEFPTEAVCGEQVSGTFSVFNIGDEDQDQVLVRIFSKELNLNDEVVLREDLDQGDDKKLDYTFTIPQNIADGFYTLNFETEYSYDDDDGTYDDSSEDTFTHRIKVFECSGNSGSGSQDNFIDSVTLESDAVAGESLIVKAVISNTGSDTASIVLSATGYQSWASLDSISERILSLAPGASKTVTLTFKVNEDASGTESFSLEANSEGNVETQDVEVSLAEGSSFGGFNFSGNGLIWIIGIVNVILIILIVVVAIRLSR